MLHGTLNPDFAKVADTLRRILPRRGPGGAAVCVYHRGEKVVDVSRQWPRHKNDAAVSSDIHGLGGYEF